MNVATESLVRPRNLSKFAQMARLDKLPWALRDTWKD